MAGFLPSIAIRTKAIYWTVVVMVQLQHDLTLTLQALVPSGLVLSPQQQVGRLQVLHAVVHTA